MIAFLYYPVYLMLFWYRSVLGGVFTFFIEFNRYTASLLSLPLLIRTFFKPLKNEYREGLVFFSIIFGMFIKSGLIIVGVSIMAFILFIELLVGVLLGLLPVLLILLMINGAAFLP